MPSVTQCDRLGRASGWLTARAATALATVCLGLLSSIGSAWGEEPVPRLSLDQALELAERENPALRAKRFELAGVRANEITASLRPNPTAAYTGEKFGATTSTQEHTVTLGQTLETGGKRQRRMDSARLATQVTAYDLADVRRQVLFEVKRAFTAVLVAQGALELAEENLKTLGEVERIQRFRAERGDISELELLRIQVQRFTFERDAADARQAVQAAKIALRAVVAPERLPEVFDVDGKLEFREIPLNVAELHRRALDKRPDVLEAEAARQKTRADVNLARANAWWDVTPQIEYKRTDGNEHTVGVGLSIPIRIFDRNQGEIARTQAEVQRVDAQRAVVLAQVVSQIDTAISALRIEREKFLLLRDVYLPKAQRARETVEFAYRRGGLSVLDFLDAQRTYRETALAHLQALGNYSTAVYQLEGAVGGSLSD